MQPPLTDLQIREELSHLRNKVEKLSRVDVTTRLGLNERFRLIIWILVILMLVDVGLLVLFFVKH